MNCPPAPRRFGSLGIMPANIYPHYKELVRAIRLYGICHATPESADKAVDKVMAYMRSIVKHSPYELTEDEQANILGSVEVFVRILVDYRPLHETLTNLGYTIIKPPIPED